MATSERDKIARKIATRLRGLLFASEQDEEKAGRLIAQAEDETNAFANLPCAILVSEMDRVRNKFPKTWGATVFERWANTLVPHYNITPTGKHMAATYIAGLIDPEPEQGEPVGSELSGSGAQEASGQDDTKNDTPKKKPLRMTKEAVACARIYREGQGNDDTAMKTVISDYVRENGGSHSYIMRVLNDNPDQWKNQRTKTTKKR